MYRILFTFSLFLCILTVYAQEDAMHQFIDQLMLKMSMEEKIGQLNLVTPGGSSPTGSIVSENVEEKIAAGQVGGIFGLVGPDKVRAAQDAAVNQSPNGIPLLFGLDVIHGHKTVFPIPIGLSCSWDMDLIEESARIAAVEASADGICWTFSPMVDISREPRWGRVAEGAGEDPYLGSAVAKAMVRGYQGNDLTNERSIMACVKHLALYGASEAGRDYNTVDMSRIRMYQTYLPPYKAAIEAGAGSVMTSFNEIDGVPASGNKWLLTDLLRNEWGFDGLVVSDYTSINEMISHGIGDLQAVSARALKAGLDMDMVGEGYLTTLKKSFEEGKVTAYDIDQACRTILEAKYRLGLFDDPYKYIDDSRPEEDILSDVHRQAARKIAGHSTVLLKNGSNTLPLTPNANIALIGALANDKKNMQGTWAVAANWENSIAVLEGMQEVAPQANISYAKGANITNDPDLAQKVNVFGQIVSIDERSPEALIEEAMEVAEDADIIVAVLGEAKEMSGEAASRTDIGIPESQKRLLQELVTLDKPIVLVLMSGRPLTLEWEDQNCDAILQTWFSGTEAGHAIADLLFGTVNPSGKLSMTFPRNVGQIPVYYNHKKTGRPMNPGNKFSSKYLDVGNDPLYPFGFGLSYTEFEYTNLQVDHDELIGDQNLQVSIAVTNTGDREGQEVVQLYLTDPVASVTRPVKELIGFQKISLAAGESTNIHFDIDVDDLKFYDSALKYDWEGGEFIFHIGGNSRDTQSIQVSWTK